MQNIGIAIDGSGSMSAEDRITIEEALITFKKPNDKNLIYLPFDRMCHSANNLNYALDIYTSLNATTNLLPVISKASASKCTELIIISDGVFDDISAVNNYVDEYITGMQRGVVPEYIAGTIKKLHYIFLSSDNTHKFLSTAHANEFVELFVTIGNSKDRAIKEYVTTKDYIKRSYGLLISLALWSGGEVSSIPKAKTNTVASVKEMLDKICNKPRIKSIF